MLSKVSWLILLGQSVNIVWRQDENGISHLTRYTDISDVAGN